MKIIVYVVIGLFFALLAIQISLRMMVRKKAGKPAPQLHGPMGKPIKLGEKALYYFYSPTCGPCKSSTPIVNKMAEKQKNIFPIDITQDIKPAQAFGVLGTPSFVVVNHGKIEKFTMGPLSESKIHRLFSE